MTPQASPPAVDDPLRIVVSILERQRRVEHEIRILHEEVERAAEALYNQWVAESDSGGRVSNFATSSPHVRVTGA